jgi:hypothetical protein
MNTDSQFDDHSHSQLPDHKFNIMADQGDAARSIHTNELTGTKDMDKRNNLQYNQADRFELLSAYLDGEVTAAERRQVEKWLVTDESVKCLYARLLKLRQGVRSMPVPTSQHSPEVTFQQVWKRVSNRYRLGWMFGGAAIATCVIGSLSGFIPGNTPQLQMAQQTIKPTVRETEPPLKVSPLMVALNNPVIEIPKTAVSLPQNSVEQSGIVEPGTDLNIN